MRSPEPDLLMEGPLADYAEGYEQELRRLGYHGRHMCRHVALLSEDRQVQEISPFARHRDQLRIRAPRRRVGRAIDVGA